MKTETEIKKLLERAREDYKRYPDEYNEARIRTLELVLEQPAFADIANQAS